jgi:hypothetical protein
MVKKMAPNVTNSLQSSRSRRYRITPNPTYMILRSELIIKFSFHMASKFLWGCDGIPFDITPVVNPRMITIAPTPEQMAINKPPYCNATYNQRKGQRSQW